jgi:hypothetical protein
VCENVGRSLLTKVSCLLICNEKHNKTFCWVKSVKNKLKVECYLDVSEMVKKIDKEEPAKIIHTILSLKLVG